MEAQTEFKKWLDAEINSVKALANSEVLSLNDRLEYFNQASALMNAKIKLQELELEETNQTIESIIESGRLSESITHNAKSECFNNATCETSNDKACVCESDYNSFNEETGLCNTCGGHA